MYVTTSAKPEKRVSEKDRTPKRVTFRFTVILEPDEDLFHAYCPAFKGLHVDGMTEKDALENAAKAARVYISSLIAHGEPLPIGPDCSVNEEEQIPAVPPGAFLRHLELQWPSLNRSGIS
jgi:predicted RNase H-like HicB family nuclease